MMRNALIGPVVAVMLSAGTVANAQSNSGHSARAVTVTATPLLDSAQRAVTALAQTPIASKPGTPSSRGKQCVKGVAIGTGAGAAFGFGSAFALLVGSGGSDSAAEILKGFASYGAVAGLMIGGAIGCK